jgi:hypothetical protein
MKDLKIRILDDDKVSDVDLWLASGVNRVSRTQLLNALFEAFHEHITDKEPTLEIIAEGIQYAIRVGGHSIDQVRHG